MIKKALITAALSVCLVVPAQASILQLLQGSLPNIGAHSNIFIEGTQYRLQTDFDHQSNYNSGIVDGLPALVGTGSNGFLPVGGLSLVADIFDFVSGAVVDTVRIQGIITDNVEFALDLHAFGGLFADQTINFEPNDYTDPTVNKNDEFATYLWGQNNFVQVDLGFDPRGVPEPLPLALIGLGLLGIAFVTTRRKVLIK